MYDILVLEAEIRWVVINNELFFLNYDILFENGVKK